MPRKVSIPANNATSASSAASASNADANKGTAASEKAQSQPKVEPKQDDPIPPGWSGPKRRITITDTPPSSAEKGGSKKGGEGKDTDEPEPHPVYEFIRDVNPDLTLPIRAEEALALETELECDMEREFIAGDVEPWAARMMRQAWSTEPIQSLEYEDFAKYRIDAEAFKAMKIEDPLEVMAFSQLTALQSTIFFKLREVGRQKMSPEVEERRYRSIARLSDSSTKLMTALQRSHTKGAQTVSVRYEHHDHGAVGQTRTRKLTLNRTGSEIDFAAGTEAKEPITVEARAAKDSAKTETPAEASEAKPAKTKGRGHGRK